ncbi:MAG: molybdenum cofactor biosynthesis protein MoaE [Nitrososphaerota archaeon]|nr:molybdenum cofactor biosynthesis protein MoaE [Nitrososphaerota archaeon]MDG7023636.1 molybdenum cofactor biosynthesis protein MoaE [Nitrososphaerota archaeon]
MPRSARITTLPIDPAKVMEAVQDDSAGGTVLFVGTIRNVSEGKQVAGLRYEVYEEMAEKKMKEIEERVMARWPVRKLAMVHRYGDLRIGEVSVAVAVSSEHRGDAFEACRYAIDTIKKSLPLWKKEKLKGGKEGWVKGTKIQR